MVSSTVGKIYTPIFSFFRKRVVNIAILEVGPVSNESPGNFIFYGGIQEFLNPTIIAKHGFFRFYAVVGNSQKIP